jgi:hypothetical protein
VDEDERTAMTEAVVMDVEVEVVATDEKPYNYTNTISPSPLIRSAYP